MAPCGDLRVHVALCKFGCGKLGVRQAANILAGNVNGDVRSEPRKHRRWMRELRLLSLPRADRSHCGIGAQNFVLLEHGVDAEINHC